MYLIGEESIGDVSGRGNVCRVNICWKGVRRGCLGAKISVGEVAVGNVSGRGNAFRGNVRWGCVWSGKCLLGK